MSQLLEQVGELIHALILQLGYPGIATIMLVENLFPPIPSEMVMPFAGFLVGRDELSFVGVWIAGTTGSVLGAVILYYIGMWASNTVVRRFLRRYGNWIGISEADYDRALRFFERYGDVVIFFGRCIPLVRSLISIPAGAHHMPLPRFLLFTALGSAIWSGILGYAGVVLGENWEQILDFIDHYQTLTIIVIAIGGVLLVGGWVAIRARGRSRASQEPTPEA
ncbi:MAG: DedA family protein [Anaerolineae bacterium]|nr:DedA family protein [Anaerolineae bacterium]